jgi:hypothetical protein
MFFYVVDLTQQFFSLGTFSTAIEILLEFYRKKTRSKMPAIRKVIGSWLCFYAKNGFFPLPLAREHIFCLIAMSKLQ